MKRQIAGRLVRLGSALSVVALLLVLRLGDIQIVHGGAYATAVASEMDRTIPIQAKRGEILDTNGRLLAIQRSAVLVYSINDEVTAPATEAGTIASVLGLNEKSVERLLSTGKGYHVLANGATIAQENELQRDALPGIGFTPESVRSYPDPLEPALGFVNYAQQGVAGVEEIYNKDLSGTPGLERIEVDAAGEPLPVFGQAVVKQAKAGDSLELTLDATLQAYAQSAIVAGVKRAKATSGRVLIMDPQTGAILAMAQTPSYNPSNLVGATSQGLVDQSVQYAFSPGSVMKAVTGSLGLLYGSASTTEHWVDNGYKIVMGRKIFTWNRKGFGRLGWLGIFEDSSDVAFMDIGLGMGVPHFFEGLHLFHMDRPTGIDLPGEASGIRPPENRTTALDLAEMSFGQTLTVTPVQMAAAVAAVADGGVWHTPHVGKELITPVGVRPLHFPSKRIIPARVAKAVVEGMVAVVQKGTGKPAAIPGYVIGGKTGTSSLSLAANPYYMGSFIGYGPVPDPRILIYVQVTDPRGGQYYGDEVAAPVFKSLMEKTLAYERIPPNAPIPSQPQKVRIPDLKGLSIAEASAALEMDGLVMALQGRGSTVTSVSPAPGTLVNEGSTVTVQAKGSPVKRGTVPDVLGLTTRAAAEVLAEGGYQMAAKGEGIAVKETPPAAARLKVGDTVTVVFAPGP